MPVEEATYISDLNETYPLGTGEPKSLGDDHLRLLKSVIKATFPNITGEVTATHAQLNALNGGTLEAANGSNLTNLNATALASGTVADARLSSNVPLKAAANTFSATQTITGSSALMFSVNSAHAGGPYTSYARSSTDFGFIGNGSQMGSGYTADSLAIVAPSGGAVELGHSNDPAIVIDSDGDITLNSVNVTDFARLSQANTFSAAQTITGKSLTISDASTDNPFIQFNTSAGTQKALLQVVGTTFDLFAASGYGMRLRAGGTSRFEIDAAGAFDFKSGSVTTANDSADEVGYKGAPVSSKTVDHTIAAADSGKVIVCTSSADDITVQASGAPPAGSVVCVLNRTGGSIDILEGAGMTLTLAGSGSTGNRTLADDGMAFVYFDSTSTAVVGGAGVG